MPIFAGRSGSMLQQPQIAHRELTRRESFAAIRLSLDQMVSARLDAMNASMEEDERRRTANAAAGS